MKTYSEVVEGVRAWAKGICPTEAGVELLVRAFKGKAVYDGAPWLTDHGEIVTVDPSQFLDHVGAWSGGEQRVARIAASFLGGDRVDLNNDIAGIDRAYLDLVLAAVAHANGSHEHSELRYDDKGTPVGFRRVSSLYPWPDQQEGTS